MILIRKGILTFKSTHQSVGGGSAGTAQTRGDRGGRKQEAGQPRPTSAAVSLSGVEGKVSAARRHELRAPAARPGPASLPEAARPPPGSARARPAGTAWEAEAPPGPAPALPAPRRSPAAPAALCPRLTSLAPRLPRWLLPPRPVARTVWKWRGETIRRREEETRLPR